MATPAERNDASARRVRVEQQDRAKSTQGEGSGAPLQDANAWDSTKAARGAGLHQRHHEHSRSTPREHTHTAGSNSVAARGARVRI